MSWKKFNNKEKIKNILDTINTEIEKQESDGIIIVPLKIYRFRAFELTSLKNTKVIILGLDPYKYIEQAHGISFSVPDNIEKPPSLKNILIELNTDINCDIPKSGNLTKWTQQGVLMINSYLTLQQGNTCSHKHLWKDYTHKLLKYIVKKKEIIIFICWGKEALNLIQNITLKPKHYVLTGTHPSPLGANKGGFFGKKYFSRTNELLKQNNLQEINWNLT